MHMKIIKETNRKPWILTGVGIASFLGCIDFTIVNTALPAIQLAFHATVTQLHLL
jgi:MFS family permease